MLVAALRQVDRDHPVGMPDHDRPAARVRGQQVEGQSAVRLVVVVDDRQPQVLELMHQPPLDPGGLGQLLPRDRVIAGRLLTVQPARLATAVLIVVGDQPIAPPPLLAAPMPAVEWAIGGGLVDDLQPVGSVSEGIAAGGADRIFEPDARVALFAGECVHATSCTRTGSRARGG